MSVIVSNRIGFSSRTGAVYIDTSLPGMAPAKQLSTTKPDDSNNKSAPWASWGEDNQFPQQLITEIDKTGILNSIIDGKSRFAVCNGMIPAYVRYNAKGEKEIVEIPMISEIDDWMDDNNHFFHTHAWMMDLCGFANGAARFMLNKGRDKIARFQRDDISEVRYEKMNKVGICEYIYMSAQWDKVGNNKDHESLIKIPLLNPHAPLADLRQRVESNSDQFEFSMTFRYPSWGKKYYSIPKWWSNHLWVKIAQGVPEMKAAMFNKTFRPRYQVIISPQYWDKIFDGGQDKDYGDAEKEKKKNEVFDQIDEHLSGTGNAYKTMFCDGYVDEQGTVHPEIQIEPIDDHIKQGDMLPDSAAANSEIAFSLLFNPTIIGASLPSGPYTNSQGGSNVREATLFQVIIHELERQYVRWLMNVAFRFNGWDKEYAKPGCKLETIIPATIPTTLDTGSNVKSIVTGTSPQPNNTDNNGTD